MNSQLQKTEQGYRLVGDVDFASVPQIWKDSVSIFQVASSAGVAAQTLTIDLSGVTRADSAGLALLIGWVRRANAVGVQPTFKSIPEQLLAIARVSGVDSMLPGAN